MALPRIRFAPTRDPNSFKSTTPDLGPRSVFATTDPGPRRGKEVKRRSRSGCLQCRLSRVRCDEQFPVCKRCQRTGAFCQSQPHLTKWQMETPWLAGSRKSSTSMGIIASLPRGNERLLKYWLEKASQIMALDPEDNPLSFPILQHFTTSPSLVHAVQSIGAAHEHFFNTSSISLAIQERHQALQLVRLELQSNAKPFASSFLTVFLLGSFTSWIEGTLDGFGIEHLLGGRAIIDILLAGPSIYRDPNRDYVVGCYVYWDSCCSFIAEPGELPELNTPEIYQAVQEIRHAFHPISGFGIEIFYLIGNLGRYCRRMLAGGEPECNVEAAFEEQLLEWEFPQGDIFSTQLLEGYRKHGLIMLYRICGRSHSIAPGVTDSLQRAFMINEIIKSYAVEVIQDLSSTPVSSHYFNFHAIPLLTAGSELTTSYESLRDEVKMRFQALFSMNRVPSNLLAIQLLQEVWSLRDGGVHTSWLEVMLAKGWKVKLS